MAALRRSFVGAAKRSGVSRIAHALLQRPATAVHYPAQVMHFAVLTVPRALKFLTLRCSEVSASGRCFLLTGGAEAAGHGTPAV